MLHGDDALMPLEAVPIAHSCTIQQDEQTAARPCRNRTGQRIGYARITGNQTDLRCAITALLEAGARAANIHPDYGPHARMRYRDGLHQALVQADTGDTLIVPSLVAFARSQGELDQLLTTLHERQINLQIRQRALADIPPAEIAVMTAAITDQLLTDIHHERAAARAAQAGRRGSRPWALTPEQTAELIGAFDAGQPRRQIAIRHHIGPSPRILDTVVVDYAAVGSVAARWAS